MQRKSRENPRIREFILENLEEHETHIVSVAAKAFTISRTAINGYMQRLVREGIIIAQGNTKSRIYKLKELDHFILPLRLTVHLEEDMIWRHHILPRMADLKPNIIAICEYGFTEMLNNAVDHSASFNALISYTRTYHNIRITISDEGVGIFEKIQRDFKLDDPRSALLELSKGRLTSDPKNHAGEGIFFTSRMFDKFSIMSGFLYYSRKRDENGWLIESNDLLDYHKGTLVGMNISANAPWTTKDVFNEFAGDKPRFRKTHVPISLGQYAGESLVSRSQAKRILARFDKFSEVFLDFKGVKTIGQAFADEIFRVFKNNHPEIGIVAINASQAIKNMINHVQIAASES